MDAQALNQAAETLQREAKRQEQLANAAKVIGDVGTLFSRVAEAEKVMEEAKRSLVALKAESAAAVLECHVSKNEAKSMLDKAQEDAKQIVAGAQAQVEQITAEARADADKRMDDAAAIAESLRAEAMARKKVVDDEADIKAQALARIKDDIALHSDELKLIEGKIAAAREAAAKMLA